ncbi:MAG: T9SS type A sorting domain-containing protein [Calditrichaeota bacterium]|nr:T9SS type A sorting domain-containing protein [Calditrichota bacterium]
MFRKTFFSFIFVLFVMKIAIAQGKLKITTDTSTYSYGQTIKIQVSVSNNTDSSFKLIGSSSCQAQFILNDYNSYENTICTTDYIEIEMNPGVTRIWKWTINPERFGFPNIDGKQILIGYYPGTEMRDTLEFEAPLFYGGQIKVGIAKGVDDSDLTDLKDSLNVEVLESIDFDSSRYELWRITGFLIDSVILKYSTDPRFLYLEPDRMIQFDEVLVTGLNHNFPAIEKDFTFSVYPNPFNPTTTITLSLKKTQYSEITVYNILGQLIRNVYTGSLQGQKKYSFSFDASGLAGGVYILQIKTENFCDRKKLFYLK